MVINNILENNEIAYIFWGVLGILFLFLNRNIRDSAYKLICLLFELKFIVIYFLTISYVCVCVLILNKLGLWDFSLLKETFLWVFLAGSAMVYKIADTSDDRKYLFEALKENLKWTLVVEFFISLYQFNIWFELLSIPVAIFISLLIEFSKRDKKFQKLAEYLNNMVLITVVVLTFYVVTRLINDYDKYFNLNTLHLFLLSPLLAILFMPFLFFLSLYNNYAKTFAMIETKITPVELLQYAKHQALIRFNLNVKGLQRWKNSVFLKQFHNRADVQQSIIKIIDLQKTERDPPKIDKNFGWSPYMAKDFLNENNITTGYYNSYSDEEWSACSSSIKLDDNILPNYIIYYVEGIEQIANSLELVLTIFDCSLETTAIKVFLYNSETLYKKVFNKLLPENLKIYILNGSNFVVKERLFEISLKREELNNIYKGFDLSFKIKYITD